jgi:hypothetical protein
VSFGFSANGATSYYDKSSNSEYINNDSTFNAADETNFRNISLVTPAMGKEIFSLALRDSLRAK